MKILFQGDSITDAGRNRSDIHNLGNGYPIYTAKVIKAAFPDIDFEFINLGISGNRAENLRDRWTADAIEIQPDVISILIGINDTWHRAANKDWMSNDYFDGCYRGILERLKKETKAKIIILEQFLLPVADKEFFHVDLDPKIQITRKLAREYADVFVPLDGLFAAASVGTAPTEFAADGVHPTAKGAQFIAGHYLEAFRKLGIC
jgi:lysophospholipase L1-like esterase